MSVPGAAEAGPGSVEELQAGLGAHAYLADRGLATAIHLALSLDKPLLLEGEAGRGQDRGREGPRRSCSGAA